MLRYTSAFTRVRCGAGHPSLLTPFRAFGQDKKPQPQQQRRKLQTEARKNTGPRPVAGSTPESAKSRPSSAPSPSPSPSPPPPAAAATTATTTATVVSSRRNQFASQGFTTEVLALKREVLQVRLQLAREQQERRLVEAKYNDLVRELGRREHQGSEGPESAAATSLSPPSSTCLLTAQTTEAMLKALQQQDAAAHEDAVALRYAHVALLSTLDVLEGELRRILAMGLAPAGTEDAEESELHDAIDAAAIESGARQLIRQNLALRLLRQPTPIPSTFTEKRP